MPWRGCFCYIKEICKQCECIHFRYAAPISVDIEYTRGREIVSRKGKEGQVIDITMWYVYKYAEYIVHLYQMLVHSFSLVTQGGLVIGRIPIMLRSCRCVLTGKTESQLAELGMHSLNYS